MDELGGQQPARLSKSYGSYLHIRWNWGVAIKGCQTHLVPSILFKKLEYLSLYFGVEIIIYGSWVVKSNHFLGHTAPKYTKCSNENDKSI